MFEQKNAFEIKMHLACIYNLKYSIKTKPHIPHNKYIYIYRRIICTLT